MPIWSGLAPAFSSRVVIFSTLAASVLKSQTQNLKKFSFKWRKAFTFFGDSSATAVYIMNPFQMYTWQCVILPIQIGGSRASDLFLALSHIEEHGFVRLWPLEVKALLDAVSWEEQKISCHFRIGTISTQRIFHRTEAEETLQTRSHAILQGTLIEDVGWEGTESWMHSVLDLQADWPDPKDHQAFKKRLGQTRLGCLLAHHHGTQLAVVTHKNELGRWHVGECTGQRLLSSAIHNLPSDM